MMWNREKGFTSVIVQLAREESSINLLFVKTGHVLYLRKQKGRWEILTRAAPWIKHKCSRSLSPKISFIQSFAALQFQDGHVNPLEILLNHKNWDILHIILSTEI